MINIVWIGRIISVNRAANKETMYVEMNESFVFKNYEMTPIEAYILSADDFIEKIGGEVNDKEDKDSQKIICVRLRIKNILGETRTWEALLESGLGEGFEKADGLWCSARWPFYTNNINFVPGEQFEDGESLELWIATSIQKISGFSNKAWEKIENQDFYYVMSFYPDAIRIKLDIKTEVQS